MDDTTAPGALPHQPSLNPDSPEPTEAPPAHVNHALLSSDHLRMLRDESAITDEVIARRGYRTIEDPGDLLDLGFSKAQSRTAPALAIPLWNVHGEQTGWQMRPDSPRLVNNGVAKYEKPKGTTVSLDVHPSVQARLGDPSVPLWITEGVRKGDALASQGVCAIALQGVWCFKGKNKHGGKVILPDWQYVALNSRMVYVVYDSDVATKKDVEKALKALYAFLRSKGATPAIVQWPGQYQQTKMGVDDFLAQGHTLDDLLAFVPPTRLLPERPLHTNGSAHTGGLPGQPARPTIRLSTDMTAVVDQGQKAIMALPLAPSLYQRSRRLCIIARGVPAPKWLHRPADTPVILEASPAHIMELLAQAADWEVWDARKDDYKLTLPPGWAVLALKGRGAWPFPVLEGILTSPTLRPDGSLITKNGYDADTGLYLDTNGTTFPPINSQPTIDDARAAALQLQEAVQDFPFAEPWHYSAALAAMLSIVCRFTVMGNVPLFAVRANTRGSGKSLLADVISIVGTGRAAPRWPEVHDDEEERKRLITLALAGYPAIHIDNVVKPLGSPSLEMALTSPSFTDRILGSNDSREAPLSMVWLASGNNMQFKGDMSRRIVPIDLDPKMEKPEERTGFKHDPLTPWVRQERPRMTVAALTIVKAYFEAGCPSQGITPMGSFEEWSNVIRQALIWAGEADPNEGRKDIEAESDPHHEALAVLLEAWEKCYGHRTATLNQATQDIALRALPTFDANNGPNEWNDLRDALSAYDARYDGKRLDTTRIGNALRTIEGRVLGNKRLVRDGTYRRAAKWKIEAV